MRWLRTVGMAAGIPLVLVVNGVAQQPPTPAAFQQVAAELGALTASDASPAIAVAVAHHGRIIWEAGFGFSDAARSVRATANTPFAVGSIAKSVTAIALMRLVERGTIDLDRPVYHYLPGGPRSLEGDSTRLTPAALASMTGGIPHLSRHIRSSDTTAPLSAAQLVREFGNAVFPPGESYHYSNMSFGVLGHLLEAVVRKPFSQLIRDEVFAPLGMNNSFFAEAGAARPYAVRLTGAGAVVPDYLYTQPVAGAGLVSSAHDLAILGSLHTGRPVGGTTILSAASLARLHLSQRAEWSYGLGVFANGYNVIADGSVLGGAGMVHVIPSEELAVAVVTNAATDNSPTYAFADRLLQIALTLDGKTRRETAPPEFYADRPFASGAATAGSWAGTLHLPARTVPVAVVIAGDSIRVSVDGLPPVAATQTIIEAGMLRFRFPVMLAAANGTMAATLLFHGDGLTGYVMEPASAAGLGYPRYIQMTRR